MTRIRMLTAGLSVSIWFFIGLTTPMCTAALNSVETETSTFHSDTPQSPVGPPFPITAAWFKDRWTAGNWHAALSNFTAQGGDTVLLRAPKVMYRSREDLARDESFRWCGSYKSRTGSSGLPCYDEAIQELKETMGLNVTAFLTYQYEEDFSDAIMRCPKLDRKISSSRIYYRIVLPAADSVYAKSDPCGFANGSNVVVLFTSFSGVDAHKILLEAASSHNVSVYFGLPGSPEWRGEDFTSAYYAWVERVLMEHRARFSKIITNSRKGLGRKNNTPKTTFKQKEGVYDHLSRHRQDKFSKVSYSTKKGRITNYSNKTLYDTLVGYNTQADHSLGEWLFILYTVNQLQLLGEKVKMVQKRYTVSATINTNKAQVNTTVQQHVQGFLRLVNTGIMDVIIVQEGRAMGKGAIFWPHQKHLPIAQIDPVLNSILHYQNSSLSKRVTFDEIFIASNQELYSIFKDAFDRAMPSRWDGGAEFWFGLQAFEFLRDDPCLPIDSRDSGMDQIFDRASKSRIEQSIAVAGARVHRIAAMAWDPEFTCTTNKYNTSLHSEIMVDLSQPIISNCSFHSPRNLSVVVIGFSLEGETQGFTVEWTDTRGRHQTTHVNGYYFELDYGVAHGLVASLQYVMLWDIPQMFPGLAPDGSISISAAGGNSCFFQYSLPDE